MLAYYLHDLDPIIFRIYDNVGPRWYGLAYVLARDAVQNGELDDPGRITTELPANPAMPVASSSREASVTPTRNL